MIGNTTISNEGVNGTGMEFTGSGIVDLNLPSTDNFTNFVVSAWVNPSYEKAGNSLIVMYKPDAFRLNIYNIGATERTAAFSVFDGIMWHTVESKSVIPEQWTHLAATFNGSAISIYVNGVQENILSVNRLGISVSRQLETMGIKNIQSNADLFIGGEPNGGSVNQFIGLIDELSIYNHTLNQSQISALYQKYSEKIFIPSPIYVPAPNIPFNVTEVPVESLNFSQNSISKSNTFGSVKIAKNGVNGTSLLLDGRGFVNQNITKTNSVSNLTLSAWVKPNYEKGSADFTVLSKEKAFVLTIHNIIPPNKIAAFSVFDGIMWHTVESKSVIPEQWTHLAATFNGSAISIYVNGVQENVLPISTIGISISGHLETKTVENLQSNQDV